MECSVGNGVILNVLQLCKVFLPFDFEVDDVAGGGVGCQAEILCLEREGDVFYGVSIEDAGYFLIPADTFYGSLGAGGTERTFEFKVFHDVGLKCVTQSGLSGPHYTKKGVLFSSRQR